jgi:hypothetical protein
LGSVSERWKLRNGISGNFFVTEAGNALAALGNIHEGDSHILKLNRSKVNHIVTVILFDNSMTRLIYD